MLILKLYKQFDTLSSIKKIKERKPGQQQVNAMFFFSYAYIYKTPDIYRIYYFLKLVNKLTAYWRNKNIHQTESLIHVDFLGVFYIYFFFLFSFFSPFLGGGGKKPFIRFC